MKSRNRDWKRPDPASVGGNIASGNSTFATEHAALPGSVVLIEEEWLASLLSRDGEHAPDRWFGGKRDASTLSLISDEEAPD